MPVKTVVLPLDAIRMDFQPEECLDPVAVQGYVDAYEGRVAVAPVTVQFDGQVYWLRDGFHRIAAAKFLGLTSVDAEMIDGTYAEMEAEWQQSLDAARADLRDWAASAKGKQR